MRASRLGDAFAYSAAMGALEGRWLQALVLLQDMCFGKSFELLTPDMWDPATLHVHTSGCS